MAPQKTKCLFGPIHSRRLGRSLGIDLLPFKTCSLDCIYCECGRTTCLTTERREYYPVESVFKELDAFFDSGKEVDYLTFSGVGEPTLHPGVGPIVEYIKKKNPSVKTCLLTNGTELDHADLQEHLKQLDLIVPSLDGSNEEEFLKINRPAPGVTFRGVVEAIRAFRLNVPEVRMALEVFIVPGVNDSQESLERFKKLF